jgi:hypothetical protein
VLYFSISSEKNISQSVVYFCSMDVTTFATPKGFERSILPRL